MKLLIGIGIYMFILLFTLALCNANNLNEHDEIMDDWLYHKDEKEVK